MKRTCLSKNRHALAIALGIGIVSPLAAAEPPTSQGDSATTIPMPVKIKKDPGVVRTQTTIPMPKPLTRTASTMQINPTADPALVRASTLWEPIAEGMTGGAYPASPQSAPSLPYPGNFTPGSPYDATGAPGMNGMPGTGTDGMGGAGTDGTGAPPGTAASTANPFEGGNTAAETGAAPGTQFGGAQTPNIIGNQSPLTTVTTLPFRTPGTPSPPGFPGRTPGYTNHSVFPSVRSINVADNQSPRPQDRVYFTFNYFNNLDQAANKMIGSPLTGLTAYRYVWGFEKTFNDGMGSIGVRLPLDTLSVRTTSANYQPGTTTALGNLNIYAKYILCQNLKTGSLVSAGMMVTPPTGPSSFAGSPYAKGIRTLEFQPFLAYIWSRDRFYIQGFSSFSAPVDPSQVMMSYNDIAMGYFVYRNPTGFLRAIVPSFEVHNNIPLNHRGLLSRGANGLYDPAGTQDTVNLTYGINFFLGERSYLTFGWINPVTSSRPFNFETVGLFNYILGPRRTPTPPVVAGGG